MLAERSASVILFLAAIVIGGMAVVLMHSSGEPGTVVAMQYGGVLNARGFPQQTAWEKTQPVRFDADWQGKNADPERETEVRMLWTPEILYLRFKVRYRVITVFPEGEPSGRRDQLWDRDVAEAFLQPDASDPLRYKEFEVSPNGLWIDLDISHGEKQDLQSGLRRRVQIDAKSKVWTAELALPMKSLTLNFNPKAMWRANFYRVEGATEPRFYSAWRPTRTPEANFHVPEAFGQVVFVTASHSHR